MVLPIHKSLKSIKEPEKSTALYDLYKAKTEHEFHSMVVPTKLACNHESRHSVPLKMGSGSEEELPKYFKWKESLLSPVRDQVACASCWSFAVCDMLSDRISIATNGAFNQNLSVQELLSCFPNDGCSEGASPEDTYSYIAQHGIPLETDRPYVQQREFRLQKCVPVKDTIRIFSQNGSGKSICQDLTHLSVSSDAYEIAHKNNVIAMKTEIKNNGPIVGTIEVYKDLYQYNGASIYRKKDGSAHLGGHAIEIFGWSEESENTSEPGFQDAYWICRNSWGSHWIHGLQKPYGFFYVSMYTNECGIESRASSALPIIPDIYKAAQEQYDIGQSCYSSYTEYIEDPERQNYFHLLGNDQKLEVTHIST